MYKEQLDMNRLPQHIAIIMDGNGRWAKARGQERSFGHSAGADRVHEIIESATRLGIKYLTLYAFSTENWNRPENEVAALMELLLKHLEEEVFMKNSVKARFIGDLDRLPENVHKAVAHMEEVTRNNVNTCVVVGLSYSSRWEQTEAVKAIASKVKSGEMSLDDITDKTLDEHMVTNFMPDPELLIRTGGEQRLSNFLLWQAAYSELYYTDTYWPDFDEECLCKAILDYQQRQRRFGKTGDQVIEENKN